MKKLILITILFFLWMGIGIAKNVGLGPAGGSPTGRGDPIITLGDDFFDDDIFGDPPLRDLEDEMSQGEGSANSYDENTDPQTTDFLLGIDDPDGSWKMERFNIVNLIAKFLDYPTLTGTTTIGSGGIVASVGTIRLKNADTIQFRNSEDDANVNALEVDSDEVVHIGKSFASGVTITPDLTVSGSIQGGIKINEDVNGMTQGEMTAVGMYGTMFFATGAGDWNLPAAAEGMSFCLYSTTNAAVFIDPDDTDVIVYAGTGDTAGHQIAAPNAAAGEFICMVALDTVTWYTLSYSGTWVPGS
jgi:hypothetical protein